MPWLFAARLSIADGKAFGLKFFHLFLREGIMVLVLLVNHSHFVST